ncbi:hypothetical protein C0J52_26165, partial [Blattella germanica]
NPTPVPEPLLEEVIWPPVGKRDLVYLNIDNDLSVQRNPKKKSLEFWSQIHKNYSNNTFVLSEMRRIICVVAAFMGLTLLCLLTIYLLISQQSLADEEQCLVKVQHGFLQGQRKTSLYNQTYCAFQGIPFAKPPIGERRFKAAVPTEGWQGIYNATEEKSMCPQSNLGERKYEGEEDCLYLNPSEEPKERIATLVFIHGGAFMSFLSIPELGIPGNNGLKDQSLALRWVHDNIRHFGGDNNNVTIMGESAGAASVHYHTMSNMSEGLFQKAIMQSGTATTSWAYKSPEQMNSSLLLLSEAIDCNDTETFEGIHKCLMEESPELLAALSVLGLLPTTEEEIWNGEENFITQSPHDHLYSGNFHNVSILLGSNAYESSMFVTLMLPLEEDIFDDLWYGLGERYFIQNQIDEKCQERLKNCTWKTYFKNDTSFEDGMLDVLTDLLFLIEIDITAKKFAIFSSESVFYYYFRYDGELCLGRLFNWESVKVPTHAEELTYLFRNEVTPPVIDSEAWKISRKMVKLWTNFVKTGHPSLEMDVDGQYLNWEPFTMNDQQYLEINTSLTMKRDLHKERLEMWQRCK